MLESLFLTGFPMSEGAMTGDGVDGSVAAFVPTKVRALLEITLHDLGPAVPFHLLTTSSPHSLILV